MTTLHVTFSNAIVPMVGTFLDNRAIPYRIEPLEPGSDTATATIYASEFLDLISVVAFLYAMDAIRMVVDPINRNTL